ncbi:3547_t:CDS:2 [Scutellospora calospora]|uniref:3547_t:CDS:1 n=1 Tax=Scutellospora calospora TaxID=85575 RepID=A0ACA9KDV8_9GLOM|nr:3547_t:CDS:2 [Scutellospora calospora]
MEFNFSFYLFLFSVLRACQIIVRLASDTTFEVCLFNISKEVFGLVANRFRALLIFVKAECNFVDFNKIE